MPESEPGPAPPDGTLLRDMSGSEMRHPSAVSSEQQLLRLAEDPLLLRAFLLRQDDAPPPPSTSAGGQISIALACSMQTGGGIGEGVQGGRAYEGRESLREPSLAPTPFAPSPQDREEAFDLGAKPSGTGPRRLHTGGVLLAAVLGLWLVLMAAG